MHLAGEGVSGQVQEDLYREAWRPIEELLGDDLTEFLRADAMRSTGEVVRQKRVYETVRDRLRALEGVEALEGELRRLREASTDYARFGKPEREEDADAQRVLRTLQLLKQTTPYPLLLELWAAHREGRVSRDELRETARAVESFVVRRLVCSVPTNQLQRLFVSWAHELREERPSDAVRWLRERMASGQKGRRWPDDTEFAAALKNEPLYGGRAARVVLERLERSYPHNEPADLSRATIEHVLPQKLTPLWADHLGAEAERVHEACKNLLGNLTLSGYNSELSTKPFKEKRVLLAQSHFNLNHDIAHRDRWDEAAIRGRGETLARRACKVWPGPDASAT